MRLMAEHLSVTVGQKTLLHNMTFNLDAGEIVGIIGPNGAGKSSLLKVLAGLMSPTTGTVHVDGRALHHFNPLKRGRTLAYLPQLSPIPYGMSVQDVVALGRLPHQRLSHLAEEKAILTHILAEAGLTHHAERPIESLSGGERARVFLARAMAVQAPLLLVDEPVAALDPAHALHVMHLLRNKARQGHAVAVVLHDLALAARFCTRIILLHQGHMEADGTPNTILTPQCLTPVYGVTMRMLDNVPVPWDFPHEQKTSGKI